MKYEDFVEELRCANLTLRAFAGLLSLNPNSLSNYKMVGKVPSHLGVIAVLVRTMNDAGLDYRAAIARVPVGRKAARGRSATADNNPAKR